MFHFYPIRNHSAPAPHKHVDVASVAADEPQGVVDISAEVKLENFNLICWALTKVWGFSDRRN